MFGRKSQPSRATGRNRHRNRRKKRRPSSHLLCRTLTGFETLEPRWLLAAAPLSDFVNDQVLATTPTLENWTSDGDLNRFLSSQADMIGQSAIGGQVVFLSLDGATGVDYHGPISVEDIDVPAFVAHGNLAGQEDDVLLAMVQTLNSASGDMNVVFTTEHPQAGEFSVVYVGGGEGAFSQWGHFYGLAEQIDVDNQDHSDNALVFTDEIPTAGLSAGEYGQLIADVVLHETGHLLGMAHEHDEGNGPLNSVAFDPKVHVAIGIDAADDAADGKVTINGEEYTVHPLIVDALNNQRPYYNGGAVAGDAFPDVLMGQFVIHSIDNGTWITRVLDMAWQAQTDPSYSAVEKSQILAWSYGFVTHSAGDHWAHTLVNSFAEGVAPGFGAAAASIPGDQRDLGNMLRHFMTEAYIADALPGFDGNKTDRTEVVPGSGDFTDDTTPADRLRRPDSFHLRDLSASLP